LQYLRDGAKLWNNGRLLQRVYKQNNTELLKRDYLSNKEYKSGILENINHACGRITKNGSIFSYEYHLNDHLGNVRTVFSDSNNDSYISATEVMQRNDYYAFGLEQKASHLGSQNNGSNTNRYKYNGKEELTQMNLGLLDYGARNLDKALGRWRSVDPKSSAMTKYSPYCYAFNNPTKFVDPDGKEPIDDYILKSNGQISLLRKTNDKFDRLIPLDFQSEPRGDIKPLEVEKGILDKTKLETDENSVPIEQNLEVKRPEERS
jgi:RHS repeat-associated protein